MGISSTVANISGAMIRTLTSAFLTTSKKLGFSDELGLTIVETMASKAKNYWVGYSPTKPVSLSLNVTGIAPLRRFTDPNDTNGFLAWFFKKGSHVTIPGLADQAPVRNGYLQIQWYKDLDYYYEFTGSDKKEYFFRGSKNLRAFNQLRAWTTLYGGVYETKTGKKVIESTTVFGETQFAPKAVRFMFSFKLQECK